MARYLVNFGDSWAHGVGTREYPVRDLDIQYAHQLSHLTRRHLIDLSEPSTSVAHLVLQFRRFVQEHYQPGTDYLAVFFIPAQERQMVFDSQGLAQDVQPWNPQYQTYYQTMYTDQLGSFALNTALMTLQALSRYYGIDDRYLLGWQYPALWPEVDRIRFYQQARITAMELLGETDINECRNNGNGNFIPGDGHPSAAGHTQIAQALHQWIPG
jgi:hypothetical protein